MQNNLLILTTLLDSLINLRKDLCTDNRDNALKRDIDTQIRITFDKIARINKYENNTSNT